ncbi:MAG: hypothetical protein K6T30_08820 [Alicyclobacillus sp.]|nr:hypothetical protein [Alicyclobacillus sp.]
MRSWKEPLARWTACAVVLGGLAMAPATAFARGDNGHGHRGDGSEHAKAHTPESKSRGTAAVAALQAAIARTKARVDAAEAAYQKAVQAVSGQGTVTGSVYGSVYGSAGQPVVPSSVFTPLQTDIQSVLQQLSTVQDPKQAKALLDQLREDIRQLQESVSQAEDTVSLGDLLDQSQKAVQGAEDQYQQALTALENISASLSSGQVPAGGLKDVKRAFADFERASGRLISELHRWTEKLTEAENRASADASASGEISGAGSSGEASGDAGAGSTSSSDNGND